MELGVFEQIAAVLVVCVLAGGLALLLRQPLILGLIAAGIAVGPDALGLVEATSEIELLATIGISLLLFVVGLKLDVRLLSRLGPVALATGLAQIGFTAAIGFAIARGLGFEALSSVYIAMALTFSSTIIVVKLLTDRRELEELHGRVALGILIVQDLVVVLAMIVVTASGSVGDDGAGLAQEFVGILLRGIALLAFVGAVGRFVVPRVVPVLARQAELLVLAAVTWAVALAAASIVLGFSEEVGAFLAGMSLASSPYREAISGRLSTLRDFLLVFFFIELGTVFELSAAAAQLRAAIALSAFVLLAKPLVVLTMMGVLGYRKRVSFRTGLTLAQISEFSFILVALGVAQGHVGDEVVGVVTAVGLVTIAASSYLISGSERIHDRIEPLLRPFERQQPHAGPDLREERPDPEYVVIGLGRFGSTVVRELLERGARVLGVDYDPRSVQSPRFDLPIVYGDAEDPDLPERLPLERTRWVISTLRDRDTNRHLLAALRHHGYQGRVVVAADSEDVTQELRDAGADAVIHPLHVAAGPLLALLHQHD